MGTELIIRRAFVGACAVVGFLSMSWDVKAQVARTSGHASQPPTAASLMRPLAPPPPSAEIRIFGAGGHAAARASDLVNGAVASLCVTSTTGRFRLRVASQSGGAMISPHQGQALSYSVTFRDPMGAEQTVRMTGQDLIFEGRSRPDSDCAWGANATLTVESSDRDINAAVAGDYIEQLRLSIEPL